MGRLRNAVSFPRHLQSVRVPRIKHPFTLLEKRYLYHFSRMEDPAGSLLRGLLWCHCRESGSPEVRSHSIKLDCCLRRNDTLHHSAEVLRKKVFRPQIGNPFLPCVLYFLFSSRSFLCVLCVWSGEIFPSLNGYRTRKSKGALWRFRRFR